MSVLSNEYISQDVIFLEYRSEEYAIDSALPFRESRLSRFMDTWEGQRDPEDAAPHTPLVMVGSGREISFGFSDYRADYRRMINKELSRPAEVNISARKSRPVGGSFIVDAQVTNATGRTLSSAENEATLHVVIFEGHHIRDIVWEVDRMGSRHIPFDVPLYPGETRLFKVQLDGFRRDLFVSRVDAVVFVDALTSRSPRRWDMLQAIVAGSDVLPASPTVAPTSTPTEVPPTAVPPKTVTATPVVPKAFLPVAARHMIGFPTLQAYPTPTITPIPTATPDDVLSPANIHRIKVVKDYPVPNAIESVAMHGSQGAWGGGGSVWLYDLESDRQLHHLTSHQRSVHGVAFSPDGKTLYTGGADPGGGQVRAWSLPEATELWAQSVVDDPWGVHLDLGGLGRYLATNAAQNVKIWRVTPDGMTVRGNLGQGHSPVFAPGDTVVGFWRDGVQLSTKDGDAIRHLPANSTPGYGGAVAFSPDGRLVAGGAADGTVHVWLVNDGSLVWALTGHKDGFHELRFSPDGRMLFSASADRTVRAWDISTGRMLRVLNEHLGPVMAMTISTDGRTVLTGSNDGTVKVWGLR